MPQGYYTVEQWKPAQRGWFPVLHLDAGQSLTKALQQLERRGKLGLFRVMQMQRCVWGEMEGGTLRLHGSHASSPKSLAEMVKIFEREGGRRPAEKARQERMAAKRARKS